MSANCAEKVFLITGAGSGIGQELAIVLAAKGAKVILAGRRLEALQQTGGVIESRGGRHVVIQTDVTNEASVAALFVEITNRYGKLDAAINCAGIVRAGLMDETSREVFLDLFDINTLGTWLCMKHEIIAMKKSGGGSIVNIGSNVGYHLTRPGMGAYAASKAAVTALTRTAALEVIGHGIRINAVSPGPVDTALSYRAGEDKSARDARIASTNPSKRVGRLDEIVSAVLWLCTDATYVVGQDIVVDGGASA
jgi:NAD(P)-dependent dehydrogenase (short-subunit alcohol dehydrogenase family)